MGCCPIDHTRCSSIHPTLNSFCKNCSIYTALYVYVWWSRVMTQTVSRRMLTAESLACWAVPLKLHNLYCSPDVVRMIKSRSIRRAGQVALTQNMINTCSSNWRPEGPKCSGKWKSKVVRVHAMKANRGITGTAPLILNLSTRWRRWLNSRPVCFIAAKERRYWLHGRLARSQSWPTRFCWTEKSLGEANAKVNVWETGWEGVDWNHSRNSICKNCYQQILQES